MCVTVAEGGIRLASLFSQQVWSCLFPGLVFRLHGPRFVLVLATGNF